LGKDPQGYAVQYRAGLVLVLFKDRTGNMVVDGSPLIFSNMLLLIAAAYFFKLIIDLLSYPIVIFYWVIS